MADVASRGPRLGAHRGRGRRAARAVAATSRTPWRADAVELGCGRSPGRATAVGSEERRGLRGPPVEGGAVAARRVGPRRGRRSEHVRAVPARSPRPRAELPGDVVAAIRTAGASLTNRGREHLVTLAAESVEAYNRGRYEDAARWIRPVAERLRRSPRSARWRASRTTAPARWRAALAHLRAHADLTGDVTHLPALMDCERALGHPRKVGGSTRRCARRRPTPEVLSEARIVFAATLSDRGKLEEAIALLVEAGAERRIRNPADRHVRQWYVLADLYRAQRRRPARAGAVHSRRARRPRRLRRRRPTRGARRTRRHARVGVRGRRWRGATTSPLRDAVTDRFGLVLVSASSPTSCWSPSTRRGGSASRRDACLGHGRLSDLGLLSGAVSCDGRRSR